MQLAQFSKKQIALYVWIVFSVIYISYSLYSTFTNVMLQGAYQTGRADAVGAIIEQSKQCQPFNVFVGNNKTDLISVACLKQQDPKLSTGSGSQK